jgi:hypothetical protein
MSSMNQDDHPAYNIPDATEHHDGTVLADNVTPIRPSNLERDIAGARRQVENERSLRNIANQGPSGVDKTNLTTYPVK